MRTKFFFVFFVLLLLLTSGCKIFKSSKDTINVPVEKPTGALPKWLLELPERNDISATLDIPLSTTLDVDASLLTPELLTSIASNYVAVGGGGTAEFTLEQINLMKSVNQNILVFRYMSFASGYNVHSEGKNVLSTSFMASHPEIFLKTTSGEFYTGLLTADNHYVLDPGSEVWKQILVDNAIEAVTLGSYDGIMADETVIVNSLYKDFAGINPRTGKPYTTKEWRDDMYTLLGAVNEAIGEDKLLIANSIRDGSGYFDEGASRFLEVTDGFIAEGFKGPGSWDITRYPREEDWVQNVEMLRSIQNAGGYVGALAKYEKSKVSSMSEFDSHVLFDFATFMLGKGGASTFNYKLFDPKLGKQSDSYYLAYYTASIGSPTGDYYKASGVYQRDFEGGKILVNPSDSSVTVSLGGEYKDLEGITVSEITMDSHRGMILLL